MDKKHYFIVVEGISGTGKTSVATEVAKLLEGLYIKTPIDPINIIRDKVDSEMSTTAKFLYYLSGIHHLSEQLIDSLKRTSIVCDKYIYSVLAFTKVKEPSLDLPEFVTVIEPDIKFLITVPENIRLQRIKSRDSKILSEDKIIRDRETQNILRSFSFIEIDNSGDLDTTMNQIKGHLKTRKILN